MSTRRLFAGAALALALAVPGGGLAAPPEDALLAPDQHATDKGRRLAATHLRVLRDLNAEIYHCMAWVEVQRQSIGFFKPRHATQDDRYFSVRIYIQQDPSPQFAGLSVEQRASSMFSRYVDPLLRRMTRDAALMADAALDGFTILLEWLKHGGSVGGRPVHETIAVFLQKPLVSDYLAGRARIGDLAGLGRVLGWDGETALGPLRVTAWDDNFVSTFEGRRLPAESGFACR